MNVLSYSLKFSLTSFNTFKSILWSDYVNIYCNNVFIIIISVYPHLYVYTCDCIYDTENMWKSEEYLRELIISFYYVGSGVQTQAFSSLINTFIHLASSPVYQRLPRCWRSALFLYKQLFRKIHCIISQIFWHLN